MPDGTIQDSRNPYSPQWGLLKVNNPNKIKEDENQRDPQQNDDWNEYALFISTEKRTEDQVRAEHRDDQYKRIVHFDMKEALVTSIDGKECEPIRIRIAHAKL